MLAIDADGVTGSVYNVACGERVTLNRLVAELRELTGSPLEPVYAAARPGDIRHSLADLSLARAELGYEPSVQLHEGVRANDPAFSRGRVAGRQQPSADRGV
jgi:UDP-glucose 4-epimerase